MSGGKKKGKKYVNKASPPSGRETLIPRARGRKGQKRGAATLFCSRVYIYLSSSHVGNFTH